MPKSSNYKMKLLYLERILNERTDEEHPLTTAEIIDVLNELGISAERKSIYDDINILRDNYGTDIQISRGKTAGYYVGERKFQLPELKLLVDAVQSSKFITKKKSAELIAKLEGLTSKYYAKKLNRQVYVANRVKSGNEAIYYSTDNIHEAIASNLQISFTYCEWTLEGIKRPKHDGKLYIVSPWALTWDDENYYMIAFDSKAGKIKHYRVDKMENIKILDAMREGAGLFNDFDMAVYSKQVFGMYGGQIELVTLMCDDSLINVIKDRFGDEPTIIRREGCFEISVRVAVSPLFYSWILGFGSKIKIQSPVKVANELVSLVKECMEIYK